MISREDTSDLFGVTDDNGVERAAQIVVAIPHTRRDVEGESIGRARRRRRYWNDGEIVLLTPREPAGGRSRRMPSSAERCIEKNPTLNPAKIVEKLILPSRSSIRWRARAGKSSEGARCPISSGETSVATRSPRQIYLGNAFLDQDLDRIEHVVDTNVTGTLYLIIGSGGRCATRDGERS